MAPQPSDHDLFVEWQAENAEWQAERQAEKAAEDFALEAAALAEQRARTDAEAELARQLATAERELREANAERLSADLTIAAVRVWLRSVQLRVAEAKRRAKSLREQQHEPKAPVCGGG